MKSLSINEAKFIYYAHNKLDYTQLDKVQKIQAVMGSKFPESDRSIDAHSYYMALKKIGEGEGIPAECVLCGMELEDEHMMCKECEATIHSMASRGYKEVKEIKDREKARKKRIRMLIVGGVILGIALVAGITFLTIWIKIQAGIRLEKKLANEGYVQITEKENPYSADIDSDLQVVASGLENMGDDADSVRVTEGTESEKELEISDINIAQLDIRDAYHMLGRDFETVLSVYGNASETKNGTIRYDKTGLNLQYDDDTHLIYQIYADTEVANKNKIPICGIYVGLDVITAINELEKAGLNLKQVDLYTWECLCKNGEAYVQIKITEKSGKVGVVCINVSDFLQ
ncbi:MAG: hypothetical protein KBS96_04105 [Lachnospiraceae bacterium]|nr:hypothetical protein [Candidatus Colinaster scatohippi]